MNLPSTPRRTTIGLFLSGIILTVFVVSSCTMLSYKPTRFENETGWLYKDLIQAASVKANRAFGSLSGGFPTHTLDGNWVADDDFAWAKGYYPGILWLIYQSNDDTTVINLANTWIQGLEPMKDQANRFGLGMVFYPTYVRAYQITGNRAYRTVALEAAEKISARFTEAGYFPAWGEAGDKVLGRRLSIESLMDLDLLYWASEATGNPEFTMQANSHAAFTISRLIEGDGRILHVADFDPSTGTTYGDRTPELADNVRFASKGYNASSVWARGQAWAIYGLASAYRHSQNTVFLNAGLRAADYLIANLPADGIPVWDFELPSGGQNQKDTAAASIAAAGLLRLSKLTPTAEQRMRFQDTAYKIISELNNSYLSESGKGLLEGGVWSRQGDRSVSGATSWGDFHFVESLLLLQDIGA